MTLLRVERKILVFNKMKREGLDYEQACKKVNEELAFLEKQNQTKRKNARKKMQS